MAINVRQKQSWKDFSNEVGFNLVNEHFTEHLPLSLCEAILQNRNDPTEVDLVLQITGYHQTLLPTPLQSPFDKHVISKY